MYGCHALYDQNGEDCDYDRNHSNRCDPFVKIRINGVEVYNTKTKHENSSPYFGDEYKSDKKYSENVVVKIQLWDDDSTWFKHSTELMSEWTLRSPDFGEKITLYGDDKKDRGETNRLTVMVDWINE